MEFVTANHKRQKETLDSYAVAPRPVRRLAPSSLPRKSTKQFGAEILETLHNNGHLVKRTTPQFYDAKRETFLNGRQVVGHCPIAGCQSEKGYADECSLGHQYEPKELIAPKSTLTGDVPEMRDVTNWYVPLDHFSEALRPWLEQQLAAGEWRDFAVKTVLEYFEPPDRSRQPRAARRKRSRRRPRKAPAARAQRRRRQERQVRLPHARRPRRRDSAPWQGPHQVPHGKNARPLPPHGQPRLGPPRSHDRWPRRPHLLGLARVALGAHLVRLRAAPNRARRQLKLLERLVVHARREALPVHRRRQSLLLRPRPGSHVPRHAGPRLRHASAGGAAPTLPAHRQPSPACSSIRRPAPAAK